MKTEGFVASERLAVDAAETPWFAVQTQPRREEVAEAHLARLGAPTLCPRYRRRVILHGYRRDVVRPLFPGYVFAAFDPRRGLKAVHYARGVRGVVMIGGEPAEAPADLIRGLAARMRDGFVVLEPPRLTVGQRVEITYGPFEGYTGIFQEETGGAERVAILLDTLSYNARAVLDRAAVRAVA
jgi:transcriptional antiterminator RfaH